MKKFASSRSLNKILAQCDSSSREYEEIQAVERKWHLHLATPRRLLLDRRSKASLFFAAPPPPKRAPSTTLTLRSKSMTAELEELEKLDEILAAAAEPALRPDIADADSRAATVKQRPTSRRITPAEISSLFERQGLPGPEKLPGSLRKGIPRTKSVAHPCRTLGVRGAGCRAATDRASAPASTLLLRLGAAPCLLTTTPAWQTRPGGTPGGGDSRPIRARRAPWPTALPRAAEARALHDHLAGLGAGSRRHPPARARSHTA
uniref:Uncharacterized protein n=1 Tax=Marmota marmota marmota TaxID=9994 RepID=A0A8C5YV40_MARMA